MKQMNRLDPVALSLALIPVAVQIAVIVTLLSVVEEDTVLTLTGAILGLLWLRGTERAMQDNYAELRAQRHQFVTLGSWLGRDDAEEEADRIYAETLMTDGSLENQEYKNVVVADSVAKAVQTVASVLIQLYLLVVVYQVWSERAAM
jgi:hypothetical protein